MSLLSPAFVRPVCRGPKIAPSVRSGRGWRLSVGITVIRVLYENLFFNTIPCRALFSLSSRPSAFRRRASCGPVTGGMAATFTPAIASRSSGPGNRKTCGWNRGPEFAIRLTGTVTVRSSTCSRVQWISIPCSSKNLSRSSSSSRASRCSTMSSCSFFCVRSILREKVLVPNSTQVPTQFLPSRSNWRVRTTRPRFLPSNLPPDVIDVSLPPVTTEKPISVTRNAGRTAAIPEPMLEPGT